MFSETSSLREKPGSKNKNNKTIQKPIKGKSLILSIKIYEQIVIEGVTLLSQTNIVNRSV